MHLQQGTLLHGGKYQIVRFIASGGFGCTYEAEHLMLDKKVAIKEFFPKVFCNRDSETSQISCATESQKPLVGKLKKKFLDEARSLARLSHTGIVKVTDVFEENGTAYYVMDYIEGKSINEIIREKGPLTEKEALKYIHQVCEALSYVHDKNRLHLDIKPANIMIDEEGNATLIDFGASKQYDEENGENTSTIVGKTPGFAPIEQMGNDVSRFKPATDVYSIGATLYKCLTGKTPLESNLLADGDELEELPSNISEPTKKAIKAAMEVSSRKRPQSVSDFVSILDSTNADVPDSDKSEKENALEDTVIEVQKPLKKLEKSEPINLTDEDTAYNNLNKSNSKSENKSIASDPSDEQTEISNEKLRAKQESTTLSNKENKEDHDVDEKTETTSENSHSQQKYKAFNQENNSSLDQNTHPNNESNLDSIKSPAVIKSGPQASARAKAEALMANDPEKAKEILAALDKVAKKEVNSFSQEERKSSKSKILIWSIAALAVLLICLFAFKGSDNDQKETQTSYLASDNQGEVETIETIEEPKILEGEINGHQWVDLGLPSGLKWATCNVGANSPEEYGNYFAWGEISTKSSYDKNNSETYGKDNQWLSDNGYIDSNGNLTLSHDVAQKNWGGLWRMPTNEEIKELKDNTTFQWTTHNGVNGRLVTSKKNGNSIFLPALGWRNGSSLEHSGELGHYWSSTPDENDSGYAYYLRFYEFDFVCDSYHRFWGHLVRPVSE